MHRTSLANDVGVLRDAARLAGGARTALRGSHHEPQWYTPGRPARRLRAANKASGKHIRDTHHRGRESNADMIKRRPHKVAIVTLLPCYAAATPAQAYHWTAPDGSAHYGDAPPSAGQPCTRSDLPIALSAPVAASSRLATGAARTAPQPVLRQMDDTAENRARLCAWLSADIGLLAAHNRVAIQTGDGRQQALSEHERNARLKAARTEYTQYCDALQ